MISFVRLHYASFVGIELFKVGTKVFWTRRWLGKCTLSRERLFYFGKSNSFQTLNCGQRLPCSSLCTCCAMNLGLETHTADAVIKAIGPTRRHYCDLVALVPSDYHLEPALSVAGMRKCCWGDCRKLDGDMSSDCS